MELTLLAPTALSAACSKALAFCATAVSIVGPSTRTDIATNVTSRFLISFLPKSTKERKLDYHESPSASTGTRLSLTPHIKARARPSPQPPPSGLLACVDWRTSTAGARPP